MAQLQPKSQRAVRDWPFKADPLHSALGCEITGITLAQAVSPAMFAKVYEAFLDYELILFRDIDHKYDDLDTSILVDVVCNRLIEHPRCLCARPCDIGRSVIVSGSAFRQQVLIVQRFF